MAGEIRNKVAENTKLLTFNLEDYYQEGKRIRLDISQWLDQGFILREKDFRDSLENFNWEQYKETYIAIYCSTDAIVPGWAYMLLIVKLNPYVKYAVIGDLEVLETALYTQVLEKVDLSIYKDKFVIIKGCAYKPVPQNAYLMITNKLIGHAKSIMYGEACSSVPLYRKK
jgi:hypothetical protein|tara:strand:+ start:1156 stop:1665 length:510 start_codon:yes stop_codon:yes gene_type:complete